MKNIQETSEMKAQIERIIRENCLPEDSYEVVFQILNETEIDQRQDELDVYTAHCYRMEPNHQRYDKKRSVFPAL